MALCYGSFNTCFIEMRSKFIIYQSIKNVLMAWLCNSMYIYKYIMYKNNSILSKHFVPIHLICKHYFNGKEFCIPVFFGKLSWSLFVSCSQKTTFDCFLLSVSVAVTMIGSIYMTKGPKLVAWKPQEDLIQNCLNHNTIPHLCEAAFTLKIFGVLFYCVCKMHKMLMQTGTLSVLGLSSLVMNKHIA